MVIVSEVGPLNPQIIENGAIPVILEIKASPSQSPKHETGLAPILKVGPTSFDNPIKVPTEH